MRTLIVEDDHAILETLDLFCKELGNQCFCAGTVEDAIDAIKRYTPDIILLDILLHGEYATGLIAFARQLYPNYKPKIIMMTALSNAERLAEQFKPDHLLKKPFDFDNLVNLMR